MAESAASSERLKRLFVISSYSTCALATAALVWSEVGLVPEIVPVAAAVAALMLIAFALEGKWSLSGAAANIVGLAIMGVAGLWIAYQLTRSESVMNSLPWPTSMVPVAGPVLLLLFVAKMLRPKKIDDYWWLQLIGLVCVGLGCTLADDFYFVVLMILYLVSALWCLALFFLYREKFKDSEKGEGTVELPRYRQLVNWTLPIVALALIGFFSMPRTEQIWQVPRKDQKTEVGLSDDQLIDMNRTGMLELDPEVAFEVYVEDAYGQPKTDLPGDQRWRGPVFRSYDKGQWQPTASPRRVGGATVTAPPINDDMINPPNTRLPSSGRADEFTLTYLVKSRIGQIPFLFDPVFLPAGPDVPPVVQLLPNGRMRPARPGVNDVFRLEENILPNKTRYRQVAIPAPANSTSHPISLDRIPGGDSLKESALPSLKPWTARLLERLAEHGSLPREAIEDRLDGDIKARHFETVARALEGHLARSGEYTYSLNLERADSSVDPVEDFLYNTKSGHCNRFTSALALMLRSQGIPCRVVLGYRGADSRHDGHYDIRQCYAHSWVEVLISRSETDGMFAGPTTLHWLVVDGTPADAAEEATAAGNRWWSSNIDWSKTFKNLILNYNADNRDEVLQELWLRAKAALAAFERAFMASSDEGFRTRLAVSLTAAFILLSTFVAAHWLWRRVRGRFRSGAPLVPGTEFHRRLLTILARRGWTPAQGQTPREFASSLAPELRKYSQGDEINQAVHATSELFYRVRFGRIALSADERQAAHARLDWLAAALTRSAD